MSKPCGSGDTVNGAVVQRQRMPLSGEICSTSGRTAMGAGLRPRPKGLDRPPDPKAPAARLGATPGVIEQKSADGIVGILPRRGRVLKARTR